MRSERTLGSNDQTTSSTTGKRPMVGDLQTDRGVSGADGANALYIHNQSKTLENLNFNIINKINT